jgi:hypothetical protein
MTISIQFVYVLEQIYSLFALEKARVNMKCFMPMHHFCIAFCNIFCIAFCNRHILARTSHILAQTSHKLVQLDTSYQCAGTPWYKLSKCWYPLVQLATLTDLVSEESSDVRLEQTYVEAGMARTKAGCRLRSLSYSIYITGGLACYRSKVLRL